MRFLLLTQYFPPEIAAPQVRLAAMIRELVRCGQEVEVVTAMPNHPVGRIFPEYEKHIYSFETWEGVPVHRVWLYASMGAGLRRMINYGSFAVMCLVGLARAKRPDYIFVESPPLFLSISARLASIRWSVPFIFNVADLWPDSVRELGIMRDGPMLRAAECLERWTYRRASYINAVTEGIRTTLIQKKGVPPEKVLFLPNGVDTQMFRPAPPDEELAQTLGIKGKKLILYAGTHGFVHGLEFVLQAARLLRDRDDIEFLFVGGGSEKHKLMEMASELNLNNVRFLDPVPPDRLARIFTLAQVGLCTLRRCPLFESTRLVKALPSMASGVPVLYSGPGEGARMVSTAEAGLVTDPEDVQAMAAGIIRLVDDATLAKRLGANGRKYVEEHLGWSALVSDWLRQLESRSAMWRHRAL
jgi:colanic acid biosynthesis glycosyl transferase WcaI